MYTGTQLFRDRLHYEFVTSLFRPRWRDCELSQPVSRSPWEMGVVWNEAGGEKSGDTVKSNITYTVCSVVVKKKIT